MLFLLVFVLFRFFKQHILMLGRLILSMLDDFNYGSSELLFEHLKMKLLLRLYMAISFNEVLQSPLGNCSVSLDPLFVELFDRICGHKSQ